MRHRGAPNWPPVWTQWTKGGSTTTLKGEIGVLRYVRSTDEPAKKCFLVTEHDGQHYVGTLLFDDSAFCARISTLLHVYLGRSIKDIGDLEIC
jgi:hypothetical protein